MANTLKNCSVCGAEMASNAKACPKCGAKNKKPIYKKWWFWVIIAAIILGIIGNIGGDSSAVKSSPAIPSEQANLADDTAKETAPAPADEVNVPAPAEKEPPAVSKEYQNALKKAKSYSDMMHMSKQGIYDQLVSEYGEGFAADAAQYAVDNLEADYCANALAKAKEYQSLMSMSRSAIYDQLISDYGEKFTPDEAQYAVDHLPE